MADNVIVRVPEQQFIRGEDGYSPEVTIENIDHGHRITITDREHPEGQTADVLDGDSAYEQAVAGGYTGTEAQFNEELASFKELSEQAADSAQQAASGASTAQYYMNSAWNAVNSANLAKVSAESAAAQALIRMNSADASAQAAAGSAGDASTAATTATTKAGEASDSATAADGSAKDSEAYAIGKRGGTDVGSADPAYHNNAKYYAQQASGSATAASGSATAAASSATAAGNAQTAAETAQGAAEDAQEAAEAVLASIPADYTELSGDVDDLKSAFGALDVYTEVELNFVSGGITTAGSLSSVNTRIRTTSNNDYSVIANIGDKILVSDMYEANVYVYNARAIASANLYKRITSKWTNAEIVIPNDCTDKYIALTLRKIGAEDEDISADLSTIADNVKYYRVSPVVTESDIDDTLTKVGHAADAKAAGDAIHVLGRSIIPEMDSFRFKWTIGKSIAASGTVINNNSFALTDIIPVREKNVIQNVQPDAGEDGQITALMIGLYNDGVFITRSRTILAYNEQYIIPPGANGMRIAYGYTSANTSPKVMTRRRLDDYFGVRFLNEAQPVNYIGDGEHPVYVAFGASTTEGDVHHYSDESITVSEYNYPDYIGKVLNLKAYNLGVGSTGFLERGDPGSSSYGTKPNIMDQIYANDAILSKAKLVTIMFGYGNDNYVGSPKKHFDIGQYTDYYPYDEEGYHPSGAAGLNTMISKGATLMGCLNWCIKWINEKYPLAQLIIIFGSPSANEDRAVTMTPQDEAQGVAPYKLNFVEDPYKDAEDHYGADYGIYLINNELEKLKKAIDIPVVNMFYGGNAFSWYSTYAKNPDNPNEYALFSTNGTTEAPVWNAHPNDLGYKYFARFVAGKVTSLFKH